MSDDHAVMHERRRHEIFRVERDGLLYRMYFFDSGEVAFSVAGDTLRLGLVTREDLEWDCSFDLPLYGETFALVNAPGAHPVTVLRTLARHLAQYMAKHRPRFFYYQVTDDLRRHRVYQRLLQRHASASRLYDRQDDAASGHVWFILK